MVVRWSQWTADERAAESELGQDETYWLFHPQRPWAPGFYSVVLDTALEDVAGNNLRGPLERALDDEFSGTSATAVEFAIR